MVAMKDCWIDPMVGKWIRGVEALVEVACKYPQSPFFGFSQSLQVEWQYLCCCVPGVEQYRIHGKIVPALLECNEIKVTDEF